jgi:hypothetical protein
MFCLISYQVKSGIDISLRKELETKIARLEPATAANITQTISPAQTYKVSLKALVSKHFS